MQDRKKSPKILASRVQAFPGAIDASDLGHIKYLVDSQDYPFSLGDAHAYDSYDSSDEDSENEDTYTVFLHNSTLIKNGYKYAKYSDQIPAEDKNLLPIKLKYLTQISALGYALLFANEEILSYLLSKVKPKDVSDFLKSEIDFSYYVGDKEMRDCKATFFHLISQNRSLVINRLILNKLTEHQSNIDDLLLLQDNYGRTVIYNAGRNLANHNLDIFNLYYQVISASQRRALAQQKTKLGWYLFGSLIEHVKPTDDKKRLTKFLITLLDDAQDDAELIISDKANRCSFNEVVYLSHVSNVELVEYMLLKITAANRPALIFTKQLTETNQSTSAFDIVFNRGDKVLVKLFLQQLNFNSSKILNTYYQEWLSAFTRCPELIDDLYNASSIKVIGLLNLLSILQEKEKGTPSEDHVITKRIKKILFFTFKKDSNKFVQQLSQYQESGRYQYLGILLEADNRNDANNLFNALQQIEGGQAVIDALLKANPNHPFNRNSTQRIDDFVKAVQNNNLDELKKLLKIDPTLLNQPLNNKTIKINIGCGFEDSLAQLSPKLSLAAYALIGSTDVKIQEYLLATYPDLLTLFSSKDHMAFAWSGHQYHNVTLLSLVANNSTVEVNRYILQVLHNRSEMNLQDLISATPIAYIGVPPYYYLPSTLAHYRPEIFELYLPYIKDKKILTAIKSYSAEDNLFDTAIMYNPELIPLLIETYGQEASLAAIKHITNNKKTTALHLLSINYDSKKHTDAIVHQLLDQFKDIDDLINTIVSPYTEARSYQRFALMDIYLCKFPFDNLDKLKQLFPVILQDIESRTFTPEKLPQLFKKLSIETLLNIICLLDKYKSSYYKSTHQAAITLYVQQISEQLKTLASDSFVEKFEKPLGKLIGNPNLSALVTQPELIAALQQHQYRGQIALAQLYASYPSASVEKTYNIQAKLEFRLLILHTLLDLDARNRYTIDSIVANNLNKISQLNKSNQRKLSTQRPGLFYILPPLTEALCQLYGKERNILQGITTLEELVNKKHDSRYPEITYLYALCYFNGTGVAKDIDRAIANYALTLEQINKNIAELISEKSNHDSPDLNYLIKFKALLLSAIKNQMYSANANEKNKFAKLYVQMLLNEQLYDECDRYIQFITDQNDCSQVQFILANKMQSVKSTAYLEQALSAHHPGAYLMAAQKALNNPQRSDFNNAAENYYQAFLYANQDEKVITEAINGLKTCLIQLNQKPFTLDVIAKLVIYIRDHVDLNELNSMASNVKLFNRNKEVLLYKSFLQFLEKEYQYFPATILLTNGKVFNKKTDHLYSHYEWAFIQHSKKSDLNDENKIRTSIRVINTSINDSLLPAEQADYAEIKNKIVTELNKIPTTHILYNEVHNAILTYVAYQSAQNPSDIFAANNNRPSSTVSLSADQYYQIYEDRLNLLAQNNYPSLSDLTNALAAAKVVYNDSTASDREKTAQDLAMLFEQIEMTYLSTTKPTTFDANIYNTQLIDRWNKLLQWMQSYGMETTHQQKMNCLYTDFNNLISVIHFIEDEKELDTAISNIETQFQYLENEVMNHYHWLIQPKPEPTVSSTQPITYANDPFDSPSAYIQFNHFSPAVNHPGEIARQQDNNNEDLIKFDFS